MNSKPKVIAIIQARMSSTRLPGKVLLPLAGKPVLWWMIKRASLAKLVDKVVVATVNDLKNKPIKEFSNKISNSCYAYNGDEDDVIGRVVNCAREDQADIVVELTADCPMIDPRHIDILVNQLLLSTKDLRYDYLSNDVVNRSWPDGFDIQVYWLDSLLKCRRIFNPDKHCGWNIGARPKSFNIYHWVATKDCHWPELGLTLDTQEDYELLSLIFNVFGKDHAFHVEDVIKFLRDNPDMITNRNVKRKDPEKEA